MTKRLDDAVDAYLAAFPDATLYQPFGVSDETLAQVYEAAVARGAPIPEDFDFWGGLPPDAVA